MPSESVRNVLLLGSALDIGGAERVIANLTRYVDPRRFTMTPCHLVWRRGAIGDELVRDGYEVVDVGRSEKGLQRYLSFRNLRRVVEERRIDLIHSHTHYALSDASMCSLAMGRRVRVLHTFHYGNYPHIPRRYQLLEFFGSRVADRLVAVGIEQAKRVRALYRLRRDRLDLVTNGVSEMALPVDAEWQQRLRDRGALVVGTICTFIEQKGLPDLLRVAAAVKQSGTNVVFVVVGGGPLGPPMEERARALGLADTVLWTGWKDAASATMLPLFDVFFQPSLWEAMSMVVLEAMAAGKPVVATDVGDNRHVVDDGRSGYIVPPRDVTAMAEALQRLAASPDLRRSFGEEGRRRHADRYTVDVMIRRYEQLYDDVLAGGRRALANEAEAGPAFEMRESQVGEH